MPNYLAIICVLISCALSSLAITHDELVYSRYKRSYQPSKISYDRDSWTRLNFTELTKPATVADVKNKKAIFTFVGLVPAKDIRVKKLLRSCPMTGTWWTMLDYPERNSSSKPENKKRYDQFVYICQAEEIRVNGQWQLYYGVISNYGQAVVPAEQLYLHLYKPWSYTFMKWQGGLDWSNLAPGVTMLRDKRISTPLEIGKPMVLSVYLRNSKAIPQRLPADLCRLNQDGSYSLRKGVKFELQWTAFDPNRMHDYRLGNEDFKLLKGNWKQHIAEKLWTDKKPTGEPFKAFSVDLSKIYDITQPGHYKACWHIEANELGLPNQTLRGAQGTYCSFRVGKRPPKKTVDGVNKHLGMFSVKNREQQLLKIIKTSFSKWKDNHLEKQLPKDLIKLLPIAKFEKSPFFGYSESPSSVIVNPPLFIRYHHYHSKRLPDLSKYSSKSVREFLEKTLSEKAEPIEKLYIASIALKYGSLSAANYLLEQMKSTQAKVVMNTSSTLQHMVLSYEVNKVPHWLSHLCICRLEDRRYYHKDPTDKNVDVYRINSTSYSLKKHLIIGQCSIFNQWMQTKAKNISPTEPK